jgi:tRNA/tmRNA/rRNA uracil-C5-methylase (TrmA/RlmC/RlmD family)
MSSLNVEIIDVAFGGDGVARHAGKVIFVPGTLPGEHVDVAVTLESKRFSRALPMSITQTSPARIENDCPYSLTASPDCSPAAFCPGCAYRHCTYETETALKRKQLSDLLQRIAKIESLPQIELTSSPLDSRYRNKITLHPSPGGAGYYAADNKTVIPISDCLLANEDLGKAIRDTDSTQAATSDLVYRFTAHDGVKTWNSPLPVSPLLTEDTFAGEMKVPPSSFSQVNPSVSAMLTQHVSECVANANPKNLIDLYCGVGLFAISAAKAGVPDVFGVEIDQSAVDCATANAKALCPGHANFICASAAPGLKTILSAIRNLRDAAVIVDPPRRGLDPQLMTLLKRTDPQLLVYVSCAADKLARDTKELLAAGYTLESLKIFDMFPRTASFETVAVFKKKP